MKSSALPSGSVVLFGEFASKRLDVSEITQEFGWTESTATTTEELEQVCHSPVPVHAVLVDLPSMNSKMGLNWGATLRMLKSVIGVARPVLCCPADQLRERDEMIRAGAYSVLMLPLHPTELRHLLGFLWSEREASKAQRREERTQEIPHTELTSVA